jgi:phage terminase large subunit
VISTEPIKFGYIPRPQFEAFHQRACRDALMVCHRRAGKTVACIGDTIVRAIHNARPNARYAYVAPFRQQAKEIAWQYLKEMTTDLRIEKPRESELRVKIRTAHGTEAWITLYGADNPDALRGLYFDGLVLDEFGDMKPSLMGEVILPCLADREGWLVIIGTAKGRNQFYEYTKKAMGSDKWFHQVLKASETGIIPADELERLRTIMGEERFDQEMECNFDAAVEGTFYASLINELDKKGQLVHGESLYDPQQEVHLAADVGLRDSTAWWFWQPRPDGYAIIDYHEADGKHVDYYLHMLADKGYRYHHMWLPHDAAAKTLATRRSTIEQFRHPNVTAQMYQDAELAQKWPDGSIIAVRKTPKLSKQHGIDAVRAILPKCYFDMNTCMDGVDALRSYRRKYIEHLSTFSDEPLHDWASNGSDGFRYFSLVANQSVGAMIEGEPQGIQPYNIGQPGTPTGAAYRLEDLFQERERGLRRRAGTIRIR